MCAPEQMKHSRLYNRWHHHLLLQIMISGGARKHRVCVCVYRISLFSDSAAIILHPEHSNEDTSICLLPLHRLSLSNLSILLFSYPSIGSPLFHILGSATASEFPPSHIHSSEFKAVKRDALIDTSVKTLWRPRAFQPPTWPHFLLLFIPPPPSLSFPLSSRWSALVFRSTTTITRLRRVAVFSFHWNCWHGHIRASWIWYFMDIKVAYDL